VGSGVKGFNAQLAIPELFAKMFPGWFAGVALAAIAIGALVPAAIMSIAAANLFTRNVYREFLKPSATPAQEARVSKWVSLVVKLGALGFILGIDKQFSINLQLLGGIWILQTAPAIVGGLIFRRHSARWFHRWALLAGWAAGMAYGTFTAYGVVVPGKPGSHFGGGNAVIPGLGQLGYIGLTALVFNLVVTIALTFFLRSIGVAEGRDETEPQDYTTNHPAAVRTEAGSNTGSPRGSADASHEVARL
jgi:SSS family solute:Na+ symporter